MIAENVALLYYFCDYGKRFKFIEKVAGSSLSIHISLKFRKPILGVPRTPSPNATLIMTLAGNVDLKLGQLCLRGMRHIQT